MNNYILKNENAIYYECGYSCDNVIFIKLSNDAYFITDARYTTEAKTQVKNVQVIQSNNLILDAKNILKKSKIKRIVFDGNDFTYNIFNKLSANLKMTFINKTSFSQEKRMIKSDDEIKILKKAAKLGRKGFKQFSTYLQNNGKDKNELYLNFKAVECMSQQGTLSLSFNPIVAINDNAAKPHARPTSKTLSKKDLLLVDAGVKYKRYCSDRTCVSSVNFENFNFKREQRFKNKKQQKIYDIVLKAQLNAINKTRSGMKASQIDKLTRSIIEKAGYGEYFLHSTGHGVGLDIHEYPFINAKSDIIIEDNMVFTIEPGIYLENKFGVRIEDIVVMKDGRAYIL